MLRTRVRAGAAAGLVLSFIFAAVFTFINLFDPLVPSMAPRIGAPAPVTLRVPYGPRIVHDARGGRSHLSYEHTRVIVPRGTVLDESIDDHRAAFAYETLRRQPSVARAVSFFVIHFIVCQMLVVYLRKF